MYGRGFFYAGLAILDVTGIPGVIRGFVAATTKGMVKAGLKKGAVEGTKDLTKLELTGSALKALEEVPAVAPARRAMDGAKPQGLLRNEEMLTPLQREEIAATARRLGISEDDLVIQRIRGSYYSDEFDVIIVGNNIYPLPGATGGGMGVANRLSPGAAIAHENGHLVTTRARTAYPGGSIQDEIQASIVGSRTPGLTSLERYQLLRMGMEDAKANELTIQQVRDLLRQAK